MKKYIQKIWKLLALQVLFFLLYSIASASTPYLTKILFDYDFSAGPGGLVWLGALYLVLIAVLYGAQYLSQLFSWKADRRFLFSLRADLFNGLFRRSYADFTQKSVGDYLSILTNDISALQQNWLEPAMDIINFSLMVAVYAVVLFVFVDFRIAAVILAASLLTVFLPKVTAKELSRRRQREQALLERYTSKAKDLLEGFSFASRRTRPAFAREHETSLDRQQAATYKRGLFYSFSLVLNGACLSLINLSAFLAVGVLLWQGEITLGTGVATLGYIESFTMPIQYILESVNSLASVAGVREKVLAYTTYTPPAQPALPAAPAPLQLRDAAVEVARFRLEPFTYTFACGKKYAITGPNGAGKSTLFRAIAKQAPLAGGAVFAGTAAAADCDTSDAIGYVEQSGHIFAAGYRENVTLFGAYDAARLANAEAQLDCAMLAQVRRAADCTTLSGGQKQLVQLVRALVSGQPILLLDEPFSAMDRETGDLIQRKLLALPDKTILVVTHDLAPEHLRLYDEVLVLQDGRLIFAGPPEQTPALQTGENG